jgi:putative aldouronate transport system permease protein
MYGVQIAFKNFNAAKGIWKSPWIGLAHFTQFFSSYYFGRLIRNTILLSVYSIIFGFPVPIMLALLVNEIRNVRYKKLLQNITYIPHFISIVVLTGMISLFLNQNTGVINIIIKFLGGEPTRFLEKPEWFRFIFISSGIWQEAGWASIIYIAALSGVDPCLYEASMIDGSSRFQKIIYISLPSIMPTIVILFILRLGSIMNVGFEKALLLQNNLNISTSDIIQTFIYQYGIQRGEFSYSAAVGLFNTMINLCMLLAANALARKQSGTSLF